MTKLVQVEALLINIGNQKLKFEPILLNPEVVSKILRNDHHEQELISEYSCVHLVTGEHMHLMGGIHDVAKELECDVDENIRVLQMQLRLKDKIIADLKAELAEVKKQ